jgi:UDP-N-acetylglucosamine diphosphorylase/glucosamine-1-phosphate N-acetyltransferase
MKAIVLAAGPGKRLQSETAQIPKHMRKVAGKPILQYVLNAINFINKEDIIIVVGFMKEMIIEAFSEYSFTIQEELLGTGHAVKYAKDKLERYKGNVLILYGDMPLIEQSTLKNFIEYHQTSKNQCTILSCYIDEYMPLGRIIRDDKDSEKFLGIVEEKDCSAEQKNIREYNTGVMIADSEKLFEELENLKNNNNNKEYYLTDIPKLFSEKNYNTGVYKSKNKHEIYGANTIGDLQAIEKILSERV